MSEKLTPQQRMAVENRGGKLLVSAAAGSGKTKVLVDRLLSYLTDPVAPANLDDFLVITYTKAAASELRSKISDKLTKYIADHPENRHMQQQIQRLHLAKISTVHGFCGDILREYAYRLDIPADFRIAEENECLEMMYQVLQQLLDQAYEERLKDEAFRTFVDTQGLGRDDRQIPEIILQVYNSALCHMDPDGWLDWCVEASMVEMAADAGETVWGAYLIDDLKSYIRLQIQSLQNCIDKADGVPGFEKPVLLLSETVQSLKLLENCKSWDEIVNHPPITYGTLSFKKDIKGSQLAEQIKAIRNSCKDHLTKKLRAFSDSSAVILEHLKESSLASEGLVNLVKDFRDQYRRFKRIRRVLDFSDIEQITLDLLYGKTRSGITSVAEEIGSRFREIMVDEYQDSNEVQDAIFSALTRKRHNCFMVGDVKQSIYQFRLADPGIFLKKYNTFVPALEAVPGEGRKVLLSSNFRSSGGVISAVNDVFAACMSPNVGGLYYGEEEKLREGIDHIPLPEPEVELHGIDVKEDTYQEEAAFVASHVKKLLDGTHMVRQEDMLRPIVADDIVILLRSPGSVGGEFRFALEQAGIPCTMGNDTDLLQTPEVETLRSILQTIHNPLQDIPLLASVASPVFGFSADELARIRSNSRYTSIYHAIANSDAVKSKAFIQMLHDLRMNARFLTVTQLIQNVFIKTGMLSIYGAMADGEEKMRNLHNFCQIAADYEGNGRKDLSYFLDYLSAMEEKGISISGNAPSGTVRIMSIHKSKGLEFPVVFLCGLSRLFNTSDTQKQVLCHKDLGIGLNHTNTTQRVRFPTIAKRAIISKIRAESVSEELRVLYVAMTRARDRLIMTYASSKLGDRLGEYAFRLDLSAKELLSADVNCPGSWILMSALQRTEAGAFFNASDKPDCSSVRDHPWSIHIASVTTPEAGCMEVSGNCICMSDAVIEKMRTGLSYSYPEQAAIQIPSKITATQIKGRVKDQEAAEFTGTARTDVPRFRSPVIAGKVSGGSEYGTALHSVLQYLDFSKCTDETAISCDISRMVDRRLITDEQARIVDVTQIARFFCSELGTRIMNGQNVLREFKFSILENASDYYEGVENDTILLQGVIDCALIEDHGITVLDFKTDRITDKNRSERIAQYRRQVGVYAGALERIYELPVKEAYIYFFHTDELVSVK